MQFRLGNIAQLVLVLAASACASVSPLRRTDPIFGKETPLLFAHRGGALEQPESTLLAFQTAKELGVDVLELDVQKTRDGRIVVWHGPRLDNVRIRGQNNADPKSRGRRSITEYTWTELEHAAWVASPPLHRESASDLELVPEDPKRELLLLSQFLVHFPCEALNVELKSSIEPQDIHEVLRILDSSPMCPSGEREVLVASFRADLIDGVRSQSVGRYATNQPAMWAVGKAIRCFLPLEIEPMRNEALQTSWHWFLSCEPLVNDVREAGGATHVFLTGLLFEGLDADATDLRQDAIDAILDRGVDGIMTDRPGAVFPLLEDWKRRHASAENW